MLLTLTVECVLLTAPAVAQTDSSIMLDAKPASRLALSQAQPDYPAVAKQNYIQGRVRVQIHVTREGRVESAHVIRGHPFLAASALETVRRWKYRPLVTSTGPSDFLTVVDVNFKLRTKKVDSLPSQPEKDLTRQVQPPEIIDHPKDPQGSFSVRLRVLVDGKGRVIDSQPVAGLPALYEASRRNLEHWTFRPAHWGALAVPWYLDVDVPVEDSGLLPSARDPSDP